MTAAYPTAGRAGIRRRCAFVGVLPPPVTGMTAMSRAIVAKLERAVPLRSFAIRKQSALARRLWLPVKHLGLLFQVIRAAAWCGPSGRLYLILDSGPGLLSNVLQALAARGFGTRLVLHHHTFAYVRSRDWRMQLLLRVAGGSTTHVFLSEGMRAAFTERYGLGVTALALSNEPLTVAPNVPPRLRGALRTIGFLGNITLDKGIEDALAAFAIAVADWPDLEMCIAGPARTPEVEALIRRFVAADPTRRRWLGPVYGADKDAFFAEIDALLFPSRYRNEAEPVTIYESLLAGVPALATDIGCIREQIGSTDEVCPEGTAFPVWAGARLAAWRADPSLFARTRAAIGERLARRTDDNALAWRRFEALFA